MAELNHPLITIIDRFRAYNAVTWALDTQWHLVEKALGNEAAAAAGEPWHMHSLRGRLDTVHDNLKDAHNTLLDERSEDLKVRKVRDEAHSALRGVVLSGRNAIGGILAEEDLQVLGFTRRLPTNSMALAVQARFLGRNLIAAAGTLPEAGPGFSIDLVAFVNDNLLPTVDRLEQAEDRVGKEAKVTETAVAAKDEALERFNVEFYEDARIIEAVFRRAGLDRIAAKIRPSGRHKGTTVEPFDTEPTPDPVDETEVSAEDIVIDPDADSDDETGDDAGDDTQDVLTFV